MGLLAASASPEHSAQDVLALPNAPIAIPGKFAYGRLSKDLEGEDVRVYVHDCFSWELLGQPRTDSDGRTSTTFDPVALGMGIGAYEVRQEVVGDASVVESRLRILPAGTKLVVLDIDGTLTTSDTELFIDIFDEFFIPIQGGYTPQAYPGAVDLTRALAAKGYEIVYMTGRPYWLTRPTRSWLEQLGFAPGSLRLANSNSEALPTSSGVATYKREYLRSLMALGYEIAYAYGNASTDIEAYQQAGVAPANTFIIGRHAGEQGTQPIHGGYTQHLSTVAAFPDANQPF